MRCQKHDDRSTADAHRDRPAAVDLAEDPVGGNDHVVEEHLRELPHPVDHLDRHDRDARRVHVDEERGDPPVARLRRPGAREQHAPVRVLREARQTFCPLITNSTRGPRRRREPRGIRARRGRCRCPVPRTPGTTSRRPTTAAAPPRPRARGREIDERGGEHLDEREQPGIRQVAGGQRGARARCAASATRRARPPPPASRSESIRVEQDRLHALHLRDLLVERSGRA